MQYIALIHGNARARPTRADWERFFEAARHSGLFRGGSAIGDATRLGAPEPPNSADTITGYMRFDAEGAAEREALLTLLAEHPVIRNGGSIDLCEMPRDT